MVERAYTGPERRAEHCDSHEENTKDISRIKGWLAALTLFSGSALTIGIFVIGNYMSGVSEQLREIKLDLKEIRYEVSQAAVVDATTRIELEQLKKDVNEIKLEMMRLHNRTR